MTVKELKDYLAEFPDDKEVLIYLDDYECLVTADCVAENTEDGKAVIYHN